MRRRQMGAACVGIGMALAVIIPGAHSNAQSLPTIAGHWDCPRDEGLIRGEPIAWNLSMEVDWQEGRFFTGTYFWSVPGELGVHEQSGGEAALSGEVRFQGVIDWDSESFVIVDLGDTGTVMGSFANDDTLQLIGFEAGEHALVAAALCVRRAGG